jgi:hypothetical protein
MARSGAAGTSAVPVAIMAGGAASDGPAAWALIAVMPERAAKAAKNGAAARGRAVARTEGQRLMRLDFMNSSYQDQSASQSCRDNLANVKHETMPIKF